MAPGVASIAATTKSRMKLPTGQGHYQITVAARSYLTLDGLPFALRAALVRRWARNRNFATGLRFRLFQPLVLPEGGRLITMTTDWGPVANNCGFPMCRAGRTN